MPPAVYSYLRFSTPDQIKGDSLRRQLERSRKWCKENGLILDESLTMKDLGLSAYHGIHKAKGALGSFLRAIENGTIPKSSILLVESLDRLSRQDVVDAQTQFLNIINAGIEIVTLMDGYRYSRESIKENWTQLIISLTIMSRANEESKTKADRSNEVWQNKRANLDKWKLTPTCPGWLKLNKKQQKFEPIPEHVETVKRIFKEYLDGYGAYVITRRLNDDKIPTIGRAKKWGDSTVKMILHNRSVLGEFQPHRRELVKGKRIRTPEGPAIVDYYPRVIDDQAFNAVQARMATKVKKGGRIGLIGNLFQHIAYCGYCGGKHGFTKKNGGKYLYLRCGNRTAGRGCESTPWPYRDFEAAFLTQCAEFDVSAILPNGNGRAAKVKAAQLAVDAAKGELADIELRIKNYDKAIDTATSGAIIERFVAKLTDAETERQDAGKRLTDATMAYHSATAETASTDEQLKSLQDLIKRLENTKGPDLIQLRQKLKNAIAGLVDHIDIFPDGLQDRIPAGNVIEGFRWESVDAIMAHYDNLEGDIPETDRQAAIGDLTAYKATNTGKAARAFIIWFKAGGWRLVKHDGKEWVNTVSTLQALNQLVNEDSEK